jgi:hypothetical protein
MLCICAVFFGCLVKPQVITGQLPPRFAEAPRDTAETRLPNDVESVPSEVESDLDEPLELRLRIAWGGGSSEQWQGQIEVNDGTVSQVQSLGMQEDEPGSKFVTTQRIQFRQPSPRVYDGVDVTVTGSAKTKIKLIFAPMVKDLSMATPVEVAITDLIEKFHNEPLDERGNRLLIRRSPGDKLRVKVDRPHLIFKTSERWDLAVQPHLIKLAASTKYDLFVRVKPARKDRVVSEQQEGLLTSKDGLLPQPRAFSITLPDTEGVYDVVITLEKRARGLSFSLQKDPPLLERVVQVVCLAETPIERDSTEFTEKLSLNPAEPGWWKKMLEISQLKRLPGWGDSMIGNDRAKAISRGGVKLTELDEKGWQAIPLPVETIGVPHILEVEYPLDEQLLGISIVDAATGQPLTLPGVDSGVAVSRAMSREGEYGRHQIVFWPKGKVPLVLLSNLSSQLPARFVKVRLLAGPVVLPAKDLRWPEDARILAAHLEKPFFAENFGGSEAIDARTNRSLKDWVTFYEGAIRLAQYLKYAGYNSAVISVASEGSSIYPSELLQPTPKFDTGTFFTTGQDPIRKDVLELLSRIFDREGLMLIPSVEFRCPLPELEQYQYTTGKRLGPAAHYTDPPREFSRLPRYNALNSTVQTAMLNVVQELAERYAGHKSIGGIAFSLESDTFTHLPDVNVGYETSTVAAFAAELQIQIPGFDPESTDYVVSDTTANWLKTEARRIWIPWRVARITKLHYELAERFRLHHAESKVILLGGGLLESGSLADSLRERLPIRKDTSTQRILLEMGLDPAALVSDANVQFVCPQLFQPTLPLPSQAPAFGADEDSFRQIFSAARGTQILRRPRPIELERFAELSPFPSVGTKSWIAPQLLSSGAEIRRPWTAAIAADQADIIVDGGWMIPLGGELATSNVIDFLASTPVGPFHAIEPHDSQPLSSLVKLRRIQNNKRNEAVAVNLSAYPVEFKATFADSTTKSNDSVQWDVTLEPYDVGSTPVAGHKTELRARAFTLNDESANQIRARMDELKERAENLRTPTSNITVLNASFETVDGKGGTADWILADRPDTSSNLVVDNPHSGKQSLRLDSRGPVLWARSAPVRVPETGRLSVAVWLRTDSPEQPMLRLAVEGRHRDQVYYRFARIGAGEGAPRVTREWAPFIFQVDQLPASELRDLRIGFDLMGKGRVWIDDVQLFDVWFLDHERDELLKNVGVSSYHLDQARWADGLEYLDSYWAEYVRRNVSAPPKRVATRPTAPAPPNEPTKPAGWQMRLWPF